MLFVAIASVTFALTAVILYWKSWQMRRLQWRILSLRDDLRDVAMADSRFAHSQEFKYLDRTLTTVSSFVPLVSFWSLLIGTIIGGGAKSREREVVMMRNVSDPRVQPVLLGLGKVFEDAFICRHVLLVALLRMTIVGMIPLNYLRKRVRETGAGVPRRIAFA